MTAIIGGTTGVTFPDSSTQATAATGFGFKNRIINGAMMIAQRGTSNPSNGNYPADRFFTLNTTSSSQASSAPTGFSKSAQFTTSSAAVCVLGQRIEASNSYDLVGNTVTVSYWAKSLVGSSNIATQLFYADAADNFTTATLIATNPSGTVAPTGDWQYVTQTFTSLPSGAANGLQLLIFRGSEASSTQVTGVQLEKGSTATSFDYRPYGTELALCQRYYWRTTKGPSGASDGLNYVFCMGQMWTNAWQGFIAFPVAMRAVPSFSSSAASTFQYHVGGIANSALSSITVSGASNEGTRISGGTAYSSTNGFASQIATANSSTAYLEFSAEL